MNPAIAGEDAGYVLFDYPNGVRALLDGNRHLDHKADNLRRTMGEALIEGTQGTLHLHGDGSVTHRAFAADGWDGFGGDCVHALQTHGMHAVLDGQPVENPAEDYLTVVRIEEKIYASAQTCRKQQIDG